MKRMLVFLIFLCLTLNTYAANYDDITIGDVYYINNWGDNNSRVEVTAKLDDEKVRVRDAGTGENPQIVSASDLLTKSELKSDEVINKAMGAIGLGIVYCMTNPEKCK